MKTFAIVMFAAVLVSGQAPPGAAPPGDAKRGKTLFDETYRCYACHGYAGETGSPRLVPMSSTERVALLREDSGFMRGVSPLRRRLTSRPPCRASASS